jgi:hypothetical protein
MTGHVALDDKKLYATADSKCQWRKSSESVTNLERFQRSCRRVAADPTCIGNPESSNRNKVRILFPRSWRAWKAIMGK